MEDDVAISPVREEEAPVKRTRAPTSSPGEDVRVEDEVSIYPVREEYLSIESHEGVSISSPVEHRKLRPILKNAAKEETQVTKKSVRWKEDVLERGEAEEQLKWNFEECPQPSESEVKRIIANAKSIA